MTAFALDPGLVLGRIEPESADTAIRMMASRMATLGYVKDTYADAVLTREREYPTGLPTMGAGVAIPHCDAGHVNKPTVALATLATPIPFGLMGGEADETVDVDIIMMLAIKEPEAQIDVLRRVATMVQNEALLKTLKSCTEKDQVLRILSQVFVL